MLSDERRRQLLASIISEPGGGVGLHELCAAGVELTGVTGASILLMAGDEPHASLCSTNHVSELIEELQLTFGEGPCIDAHRRHAPVLEPDLAAPELPRWIAFSPAAVNGGAGAVFGFPIHIGDVGFGALNLYRTAAGPLTPTQRDDAVVIADLSAHAILMTQADAAPGALGDELESGMTLRLVVHQATGMVAAQLDLNVVDALARLRAHAFVQNRLVVDLARDIVARRVRLADDPPHV